MVLKYVSGWDGCPELRSSGVYDISVDAIYSGHTEYPPYDSGLLDVRQYHDTMLLHHMAPQLTELTRKLGARPFWPLPAKNQPWRRPVLPVPGPATTKALRSDPLLPRKFERSRFALPLTISAREGSISVLACPDTGSDVNIISNEVAQALGYIIQDNISLDGQLTLANGRTVSTVGWIVADCSFNLNMPGLPGTSSFFYVLGNVPSPVVLGMPFLEQTGIMTKHRDKLIRLSGSTLQKPTILSVGRPKKHLICELNHELVAATPDSGSEIDLMSPTFAIKNRFDIHPAKETVQLADGSMVICNGFVRTTLSIGNHFDTLGYPRSKVAASIDFFLLEGLTHDIVIGEHYLEQLKVYTENQHALVPVNDSNTANESNLVRSYGTFDRTLLWFKARLGMHEGLQGDTAIGGATLDDQRENSRREREANRIANLPLSDQEAAHIAETATQRLFSTTHYVTNSASPSTIPALTTHSSGATNAGMNSGSNAVVVAPNTSNQSFVQSVPCDTNTLRCVQPGCGTTSFQTTYLLDTHMASHKILYCPIQDCPRAKGGKGFKRKHELTRHVLKHQSSGGGSPGKRRRLFSRRGSP